MANEFLNVPVPADRVQEVYELLARPPRMQRGSTGHGADGWPDDLLLRAYRESPATMRSVFDHLAAHPEKEVTTEELTEAISRRLNRPGYKRTQLAGVLGAFGRRWKNRYNGGGRSNGQWPFQAEWSSDENMFAYQMSSTVAEVLRRAQ